MTLSQKQKLAAHIFRLLKVTDISFPIGRTNKGDLSLKFTKDREDFEIILDAVPLSDKEYDNRELKSILTKYLFEEKGKELYPVGISKDTGTIEEIRDENAPPRRPRGRPRKVV